MRKHIVGVAVIVSIYLELGDGWKKSVHQRVSSKKPRRKATEDAWVGTKSVQEHYVPARAYPASKIPLQSVVYRKVICLGTFMST